MPAVKALDHVNIQTPDLAGTARFFAEVLELDAREPFPGAGTDRAIWIFDADDRAIVHLNLAGSGLAAGPAPAGPGPAGAGTGALDHVAFECEGHAAIIARLDGMGHPYRAREIPELGVRQLFVTEPNGVLLELNFRDG
jgi:catechol 2,3-dioxygenase-like lactoylglutathione lyase family enzyme